MNVAVRQQAMGGRFGRRWDPATLGAAGLALAPSASVALLGSDFVGGAILALIASVAVIGAIAFSDNKAATPDLGWFVPGAFVAGLGALTSGMTRFAPGGVHPLWAPISAGAAGLDRQSALAGLIGLAGLGALFAVAFGLGRRSDRARAAVPSVQLLLAVAVTGLVAISAGVIHRGALTPPNGLLSLLSAMSLLLAAATAAQTWKAERPKTLVGLLRVAPVSAAIAAMSCTVLLCTSFGAAIAAASSLLLFGVWDYLAGGGESSLRRTAFLLALGVAGLAILGVGGLAVAALGPPSGSAQAVSNAVHSRAIWASPWLGYGPGSSAAVARLSMDRLTLPALVAAPEPSSGYLLALEQGGFLTALPLVATLGAVLWGLVDASIRRRRLTTLYRASIVCIVFAALYAEISPAPAIIAGAAPLVFLLGCGFGAARTAR